MLSFNNTYNICIVFQQLFQLSIRKENILPTLPHYVVYRHKIVVGRPFYVLIDNWNGGCGDDDDVNGYDNDDDDVNGYNNDDDADDDELWVNQNLPHSHFSCDVFM